MISSLYGLTISSFIPKIIFVLVISILRFTNYAFSEEESLIVVPLIGLFSGFLPFFVIIYAIFMPRYQFKVLHHKIKFENLPRNFKGLRAVHISDTHLGSFNHKYHVFDRAVSLISGLAPDFIFFTGDLVNNFQWELQGWQVTFKKLNAKKGKYSVLGNHDYGDYCECNSYQDKQANLDGIKKFHAYIGFKLLLNKAEAIDIQGEKIAVLGVENWGKPPFKRYGYLEKALELVIDIPFKILFSHDPSHWAGEVTQATNIALTLSGHTHGMQAGIRLKNRKWSPIQYKYEHWAGLYTEGNQHLYVNRGLGWLGFPGRLGMRTEITCIDFSGA